MTGLQLGNDSTGWVVGVSSEVEIARYGLKV